MHDVVSPPRRPAAALKNLATLLRTWRSSLPVRPRSLLLRLRRIRLRRLQSGSRPVMSVPVRLEPLSSIVATPMLARGQLVSNMQSEWRTRGLERDDGRNVRGWTVRLGGSAYRCQSNASRERFQSWSAALRRIEAPLLPALS